MNKNKRRELAGKDWIGMRLGPGKDRGFESAIPVYTWAKTRSERMSKVYKRWKYEIGNYCHAFGKPVETCRGPLQLVHLDGDWRNNSPDNLTVMCQYHHYIWDNIIMKYPDFYPL